ncbi:MAG: 50S ribosomal protein L15 [Planctomycetota bacterium]|jgi:large subunit ribosomal protein L15
MKLEEILKQAGRNRGGKRIGRGTGSGMGKTSGRGHKGMGARAGAGKRLGYEGGQNPLLARIPKRGFSNFQFRKLRQIVNVSQLDRFDDGARVDGEAMASARLIDDASVPVKVLGNGELSKKLTVVAAAFSPAAAEKIQQAGGACEQA